MENNKPAINPSYVIVNYSNRTVKAVIHDLLVKYGKTEIEYITDQCVSEIEGESYDDLQRIAVESKIIIEQFQKLLGVYTTTEALAKVAVLMREESEIEVELNKYKEIVDWIYSIVSVNCSDVGEAHAGIQEGIEELRKETFPANVQNAKWSGHYETCPANNGGSCTC